MLADKFLEGKLGGGVGGGEGSGLPEPVISSFSSKIIPDTIDLCQGASLTKGVTSIVNKLFKGRKRNFGHSRRKDEGPSDFP